MMRWRLDDKNALVTGGTRGIGRAIVEDLTDFGARVFVVARDAAVLEERLSDWQRQGRNVMGVAADVTLAEDRERIVAAFAAQYDVMHVLVNNAGTNVRRATVEYDPPVLHDLLEVNLVAPFEISRLCHPLLRAAQGASVINIVSVAGQTSLGTGTPYAMSKAGIIQLTRNLACEWARDDIRVNSVAPWFISTDLTAGVLGREAFMSRVLDRTPAARVGAPEEVSGVVAFLALPATSYVTGQCIAVDGGFSAYGFAPPR